MSVTNYSKWDHIEVSDDEDDTHPNVDTPSLFRMRHRARVEREGVMRQERFEIDREGDKLRREKVKLEKKLEKTSNEANRKALAECANKEKEWHKKENDLAKRENDQAWNVDTLSKDVETKTHINKPRADYKHYDDMTDDEKNESFTKITEDKEFIAKVKTFGMMRKPVDSRAYLGKNADVVCDQTASYLTVWCIDLQQEGKLALVEQVAHQTISMQFILELSKHTKRHPADCFQAFYQKRIDADSEGEKSKESIAHQEAFEDELNNFRKRVATRAIQRDEEAATKAKRESDEASFKAETGEELGEDEEMVELTKEERMKMAPGGLDPAEVFADLPEELQNCFAERDVDKLQNLIAEDFPKYAEHMRKCCMSGLWVPTKDSPLYKFVDPEGGIDPHAKITELIDAKETEARSKIDCSEIEEEGAVIEEIVEESIDIVAEKVDGGEIEEEKQGESSKRPVTSLDEVD